MDFKLLTTTLVPQSSNTYHILLLGVCFDKHLVGKVKRYPDGGKTQIQLHDFWKSTLQHLSVD
eukprot:2095201-Amphidinium_carterae.2